MIRGEAYSEMEIQASEILRGLRGITKFKTEKMVKVSILKEERYLVGGKAFSTKELAEEYLEKRVKKDKMYIAYNKKRNTLIKAADEYSKEIGRCHREQKAFTVKMETFVSLKAREVNNKVDEYKTQIKKFQNALKICRGSLKNFKKEAIVEFRKTDEAKAFIKRKRNATDGYSRKRREVVSLENKYSREVKSLGV